MNLPARASLNGTKQEKAGDAEPCTKRGGNDRKIKTPWQAAERANERTYLFAELPRAGNGPPGNREEKKEHDSVIKNEEERGKGKEVKRKTALSGDSLNKQKQLQELHPKDHYSGDPAGDQDLYH